MGSFIVTTDSGCDLPLSFCSSRGIIPLKMNYAIGDKNYTDTMDPKDLKSFYDGMRSGDTPKTSQVTPYQFTEFWTPLLEKKQPLIHIALGSGISGTWANAVSAADMLMQENPGADIRVIDSTLASVGYGMLAILAADLRDCGSSADECQMQLEKVKSNINTYYTTGDLTYLYRSGRVSRTGMVSPMGTLLDELKTKVDPDTGMEFRKLANAAGLDVSGALRDFIYKKVHGKTYTDMVLESAKVKRDFLFETGPIEATSGQ